MRCSRRQFTKSALLLAGWSGASSALLGETVYTVRRGDTLGHIAQDHGVSAAQIRAANNIKGDVIRIGQQLTIPTGSGSAIADTTPSQETYVVSKGDTLGAIAVRFGVSVRQIKDHNNLRGDVIRIGQKLQIPQSQVPTNDYLNIVRAETAKIRVRRDNWRRIVVHHSGIKYGNAKKYDSAHRRRGMKNGLAYHFLIGNGIDSGDGEIEVGPRWKKQLLGGHVKSYRLNLTAIGICLVGNFEQTHPSKRQLEAFTQLMDWLRGDIIPAARKFAGHRELKGEQTICPGKNFPLTAMHQRYPG